MFTVNEDLSIYATRGDIVFFSVSAEDDGYLYKFQPGDIVRMKIFGKKDAGSVVLQRDFPVTEVCENVARLLEGTVVEAETMSVMASFAAADHVLLGQLFAFFVVARKNRLTDFAKMRRTFGIVRIRIEVTVPEGFFVQADL